MFKKKKQRGRKTHHLVFKAYTVTEVITIKYS